MNGTIEKQGTMFKPKAQESCRPTMMERRLAEKCVRETERLGETGVTIEQVELFLRALAILNS
jgi:hypothetical protein